MSVLVSLYFCNKAFASIVSKAIPKIICESIFVSPLLQETTLASLNEQGVAEIKQKLLL
jgi:hypothetical protein